MRSTVSRFLILRPAVAAAVALALTAGAVLANGGAMPPDQAGAGLERAAEVSGRSVPVRSPHQVEDSEAVVAPTEDGSDSESSDGHGATVSEAARTGPPGEDAQLYRNHGAWVSSVARANRGQEVPAMRRSAERGARP
jgi:hypothetical protein